MDNKLKKTKITHVARFAKPHNGGIESFIEMFNSCIKDYFDIEVFCCSNKEKSSCIGGVKYNRCRYLFNFAANSISPHLFFRMLFLKTDIIFFHMPVIQNVIIWFILYHLKLIRYKKMIVAYHSDIIGYDKYMKPFWGMYKYFLSKADIIHVQSPQMKENPFLKEFQNKIVMVPYLIKSDLNYNKENVEKIKLLSQGKRLLFALGRHVKYKGFKFLLESMKNIDNAVLLLGGEGALTEEYREFIQDNKLEEKIIMLGKIPEEDIEDYYEACDIFILSSCMKTETFAVVQLEAMKHSKPVINTMLNTGVNYVSVHNETGLTVEPENVEQLSDAINKLINNDELRQEFGRNARKRVEELFEIDLIKHKYREMLY